MTVNKEQLHALYVYNSVIEFIYFIIIYIESYNYIFLSTLIKHVKFFKVEVAELVSLFDGSTSEEKLCSMLKTVNCFVISENQIKGKRTLQLKNFILEDLILSKTVDLALKGCTDIEDICQNLNFNNVISIDKKNLLSILQKSSHFWIERACSVNLLHFHGILGFESYSYDLIICYFQNILQHDQILSYNEIEHHAKFISSCGMYGMLPILCVLYCSNNFVCQNGQITLNKEFKKSHKQKPFNMKLRENISETTVSIGKIVYHAYGSYLLRWTGEICSLTEKLGTIYCVIVFTDNYQGVFKVYFNKWALKLISEICNLKYYFNIRDVVEFDAKYYHSKAYGDYWKATNIKISSCAKFDYKESLLNELKQNSELQRKHCVENKCSLSGSYLYRKCFHVSCCNEIISNKYNLKEYSLQNPFPKKCETCDDTKSRNSQSHIISKEVVSNSRCPNQKVSNGFSDSVSNIIVPKKCKIDDNDTKNNLNDTSHVSKKLAIDCTLPNPESSKCFSQSVSNFFLPDNLFVFAYIFMIMADKGIAVVKQGNKLFNILFLKDSIYPPNKSQNVLVKGQKVFALIPYIEEMDKVPIATFIYGLSKDEEANLLNPKQFARTFLPNILKDLGHKSNDSCCNIVNSLLVQPDCFVVDLPQPTQLHELYELIISQCNISDFKAGPVGFWIMMIKAFSKRICKAGAISCIIKLSKEFKKKFALEGKLQAKRRRKMKWQQKIMSVTSNLEKNEILTEVSKVYSSTNPLTVKSKSMNSSKSSLASLNSYKSCGSTNSTDTFYSCESDSNDFLTEDAVKENLTPNNVTENCNPVDPSKGSLSDVSCNSSQNSPNKADFSGKLDSDKSVRFVLDEELVMPLSKILNSNSSLTSENTEEIFVGKTNKRSIRDKKSKYVKGPKYFPLKSFPFLKHISSKKRKIFRVASASQSVCRDCYKPSLKLPAYISLITDSFFFYTVNINDSSVALPLPRRTISVKLQDKLKLNSCSDIVIIPNTPVNLSHILSATIVC